MPSVFSNKECVLQALQVTEFHLMEHGFSNPPIRHSFPRYTTLYFTRGQTWKRETIKLLVNEPEQFYISSFLNLCLAPEWCLETGTDHFADENTIDSTSVDFLLDLKDIHYRLPIFKTKKRCQKLGMRIAQDLEKALGWFEEVGSLEDLIRRADSRDLQGGVSAARLRAIQEELAARAE